MMRVEVHSHTYFSGDGFATAETFTKQCWKKHLDCVCITDHDTIEGAMQFAEQAPIRIIVGEEVTTGQGDVIGLFLKEEIPAHLGIETTIERIKTQGGIVYLPHPFDEFRKSAVKLNDAEKVKNGIDVIEIFNSRTFNPKYNVMASEFAQENDIIVAVGSDAHHPLELGNSYMQMDDFDGPESFLVSLRGATYVAKKCPLILRLYIKGLKILTRKT